MAKRNIRVENPHKHGVTINLKDFNGRIAPVNGKGFIMLDEDELSYLVNSSQVFKMGTLKVVNDEELTIVHKADLESPNSLNDEDILSMLKSQKALESGLANIDNEKVVRRVLEKANELNKSVKMVNTIEAKIEELLM